VAVRPLPWVASILYVAVLVAGVYYHVGGLCAERDGWLRLAGFAGLLTVLLGLEWRGPAAPSRRVAAALLTVRAALYTGVVALDCAGLARVLFVLLPFLGYLLLGRRVGYGLAALVLAGAGLRLALVPDGFRSPEEISDLLMTAIGVVFAVSMAAVAVEARAGRARVAELAAATERNRVARDIHDSLGHHLTAIAVQLEKAAAFRELDPAAAQRAVGDARRSTGYALQDVRASVSALRSGGTFDLTAALADLVDGQPVTVDLHGDQSRFGRPALLALYRAAQEGLTNARKHADASAVTLTVRLDPTGGRLEVADEGRGFDPAGSGSGDGGGFGLTAMRERLELVGGTLTVDSAPGAGTRLTATVPSSTMDGQ
jgi:signal transduction histidine kinase